MNERIQELVFEAQTQAAKETTQNSFGYEAKVFEKFAELIIRECADIADHGYATDNFGNGVTGKQILNCFGIKQ